MRIWSIILGSVLALLLLAGCSRGPDSESLKRDIQARLDETFGEGSLTLAWLRRSGSAPETGEGESSGAIVYFDAEITVQPGYDLGSWDGPGVVALAYLLGATAEGIKPAPANEDARAPRLWLHGRLSYRIEDGLWVARAPASNAPGAPSPLTIGERDTLTERIAAVLAEAERDSTGAPGKIVAFELEAALGVIERRLARAQSVHGLASGPALGEYWRLGRAYARFAAKRDIRIGNLVTAGSVENIRLLRNGEADVALVQSDIAALALEGRGPFVREEPAIELRALASLYPEAMHIVVKADSRIRSVADLAGQRVNIGPFQSGSRHNALAVLEAHGLALEDLAQASQMPPSEALDTLRSGGIDAVFMTIGAPARLLSTFLARNNARLLPLDPEAIDGLAQTKRGLVAFSIAPYSYPRQPASLPTVASTALMLTTSSMPDGEAATLLRWTFEEMNFIDLGSLHGARISRRTAQEGLAIPLHDGAIAYFDPGDGASRRPASVPQNDQPSK